MSPSFERRSRRRRAPDRPARRSLRSARVWPLPSTPAMPTISPARTSNDTSFSAVRAVASDRPRDCARSATTPPGLAGGFSTRSSTSRPTISRASSAAFVSFVFTRPTTLPSRITVTSSEIASTSDELVRDDDDRLSLLAHAAKDGEELLDFLRRQHGGRLVENQQLRVPIERLQQLDALLLADRQVFDRARADRPQLELFGQLCGCRAAASSRSSASARARLGAEHDVLGHRHRVDQHEVLVHHADAERDGVVRPSDVGAPGRRRESRRCRRCRSRRRCASRSTCPRRSRRRWRGWCRARP